MIIIELDLVYNLSLLYVYCMFYLHGYVTNCFYF